MKIKNMAIIGASSNEAKFGNIIIHNLLDKGFTVLPINPKEELIVGLEVYKAVSLLPKIDDILLVFVVSPRIGIEILKKAVEIGFKNFYFQPGARSTEIDEYIIETNKAGLSINYANSCIMIDTTSNDGKNGFDF